MATPNNPTRVNNKFAAFCDGGIVFSLCAVVFVLPASIALLESFAALTATFYLLKKVNQIVLEWPFRAHSLNAFGKLRFIWNGFCPPVNVLNRPLQVLTLAFFISVLFSQYPALSFTAFIGKFIKCVFLYFSFIEVFINEKRIRIFLNFFLAAAFITVLNGIFQHYTGRDFLKGHLIAGGRLNSFFYTANGFGAFLLPVIGVVSHLLYTSIARKKTWLLAAAMALFLFLILVCLCWTYSRSSWIGFFSILFAMVLLDWRKIFFGAGVFLICALIFLPSLGKVRHMQLIVYQDTGFQKGESVESVLKQGGQGRIAFWEKAVSIIRSSPVCGTGLNTYTRIIKKDPDMTKWWYAHNCYLQLAAETGLIGLLSFLWVLFVVLRNGLRYSCRTKDQWPLAFLQGAVSGLFGFLIQSFFDNTFYTVQLGVLMWLFFGLIVALTRLNLVPQENI